MGMEYDEKLCKIPFFMIHKELLPFVGMDYDQYKILQIGESHYLNQREGNAQVHIEDFMKNWWESPCQNLLEKSNSVGWVNTRDVVKRYMDGNGTYTIFTNVLKSFSSVVLKHDLPHITLADKSRYHYFAFMNFYQMPSLYAGERYWKSLNMDDHNNQENSSRMWDKCMEESCKVVDQVIGILNPKMIAFTSTAAGNDYKNYKKAKYAKDSRVVYTSHPQTPYTWNKPLKSLGQKTGKAHFEEMLKKIYNLD